MMFDHTHYVPILRWKGGERVALQKLQPEDKVKMTPLVELIPTDFKPKSNEDFVDIDRVLRKKAEEINKFWCQGPLFVDFWHLDQFDPDLRASNGLHPLEYINGQLHSGQLSFFSEVSIIPVTGLKRSAQYQSAVTTLTGTNRQGACVRLCLNDIRDHSFEYHLEHLLTSLHLQPEQIDLLVDYQVIEEPRPSFRWLCSRLPNLSQWRNFIIASSAFPKYLTDFEKNRQHLLPRQDWLMWRNQLSQSLPRLPTYSDYTIQHGIYSEPPGGANFSASIRYTAEANWLIMRGEGVLNDDGPGYAGYLGNAMLLTQRAEFCGANFSYGDRYIEEMSLQDQKPGSAQTWIRAGINHHLTFVVRQIANLFGSSAGGAPWNEVNQVLPLQ